MNDDDHNLERPAFEHHTQRPKFTSRVWGIGLCFFILLGIVWLAIISVIADNLRE